MHEKAKVISRVSAVFVQDSFKWCEGLQKLISKKVIATLPMHTVAKRNSESFMIPYRRSVCGSFVALCTWGYTAPCQTFYSEGC